MKEPAWDITELKEYYDNVKLPDTEIKLSNHETIADLKLFISAHLLPCIENNGSDKFYEYYQRLLKLKQILNESK